MTPDQIELASILLSKLHRRIQAYYDAVYARMDSFSPAITLARLVYEGLDDDDQDRVVAWLENEIKLAAESQIVLIRKQLSDLGAVLDDEELERIKAKIHVDFRRSNSSANTVTGSVVN